MSKKEKLWEKIKNNPKTVRFEDIDKVLQDIGFKRRNPSGGSSHYTYTMEDIILTIPYKRPHIKAVYIKNAIEIIDKYGC